MTIGRRIAELVPEGAIVLLPGSTLLPAWSMQRHDFRGVCTPSTLDRALEADRANDPERPPLWLARLESESEALDARLADAEPELATGSLRLYRLAPE